MKRLALFTMVLLLVAGIAYAKDLKMKAKAGDYTVEGNFEKSPPVTGDNDFTIQIKDAAGKHVTDARVMVEYFMTQKASGTGKSVDMPFMKSTAETKAQAPGYKAKLSFSMPGPWHIAVKITRDGKASTAKLFVNVK